MKILCLFPKYNFLFGSTWTKILGPPLYASKWAQKKRAPRNWNVLRNRAKVFRVSMTEISIPGLKFSKRFSIKSIELNFSAACDIYPFFLNPKMPFRTFKKKSKWRSFLSKQIPNSSILHFFFFTRMCCHCTWPIHSSPAVLVFLGENEMPLPLLPGCLVILDSKFSHFISTIFGHLLLVFVVLWMGGWNFYKIWCRFQL